MINIYDIIITINTNNYYYYTTQQHKKNLHNKFHLRYKKRLWFTLWKYCEKNEEPEKQTHTEKKIPNTEIKKKTLSCDQHKTTTQNQPTG